MEHVVVPLLVADEAAEKELPLETVPVFCVFLKMLMLPRIIITERRIFHDGNGISNGCSENP